MDANSNVRAVAGQQGAIGKDELLDAMNAASNQILDSYRTWVADDMEAKPRYGQIPRYDELNNAITRLEVFGIVSPSQVAPQPQAGEPVVWDECTATGRSCEYEPQGPNGERQCRYCGKPASPQSANPVQVTDAREALIEKYASACKRNAAEMMTMPPSVVSQHFREFADEIAAIGAGGQAVAVKPLEWEGAGGTCIWASVPEWWLLYRISLRADRMHSLQLEWLGNRNDHLGVFATWDEAKAAALSDFGRRVLSVTTASSMRSAETDIVRLIEEYANARALAASLYEGDGNHKNVAQVALTRDALFSALSQPHPADERVVEALDAGYLRETLAWVRRNFEDQPKKAKEQIDLALGHIVSALSAKEGRS